MAEILSTLSSIGAGTPTNGGNTYTLMSLWEADQESDLTGTLNPAGEPSTSVLECYDDFGGVLEDSTFITGWTTSPTEFITIRPAAGQGHGGVVGIGFAYGGVATSNGAIHNQSDYLVVEDFTLYVSSNSNRVLRNDIEGDAPTVQRMIIYHTGYTGTSSAFYWERGGANIWNNLIYLGATSTGTGMSMDGRGSQGATNKSVQSNTIIQLGSGSGYSTFNNSDLMNSTNFFRDNMFYAAGPGLAWANGIEASSTITNNATSDGSCLGLNPILSVPTTAFETFGSSDYRAATGGELDGVGADLSASFTDDCSGDTRTVPWTIGAYIAAGGAPVVTPPIPDSGDPYSGPVLTAIQLNGSFTQGTDPNPDVLWTETSALGGNFVNPTALDATFAPDVEGNYTLLMTLSPNDTGPVSSPAVLTSTAVPPPVAIPFDSRVVNGQSFTSPTQVIELTSPDFGTPDYALIYVPGGTQFTDNNGYTSGIGHILPTGQAAMGVQNASGALNARGGRATSNVNCIAIPTNDGDGWKVRMSGELITDGVRLTANENVGVNNPITAILMKGVEASHIYNTLVADPGVVATGFQPDLVIGMTVGQATTNDFSTNARLSFGFSTDTNQVMYTEEVQSGSNTMAGFTSVYNTSTCGEISVATGVSWRVAVDTFTATGYSATAAEGSVGTNVATYVALKFAAGTPVRITEQATPTSSGPWDSSGFVEAPNFGLNMWSMDLDAFNSGKSTNIFGIGTWMFDGAPDPGLRWGTHAWKAGTSPALASSGQGSQFPFRGLNDEGAIYHEADALTFLADGWSWNMTLVAGADIGQGWALGIGERTGGPAEFVKKGADSVTAIYKGTQEVTAMYKGTIQIY